MTGRSWRGRIQAIAGKEALHLIRDPALVFSGLALPLVVLVFFALGVSFDLERIPMAVADADGSVASRKLLEAFRGTNVFETRVQGVDAEEIETHLRRGAVKLGLVIPRGYQRRLKRGEQARVQVLVDGADSNTAKITLEYLAALEGNLNARRCRGCPEQPGIDARAQVLFNPKVESTPFVVSGVIGLLLSALGVALAAMAVAREWERGSMEQLLASPVSHTEIVIGKMIPYLVLGMFQLALMLTVGVWAFDLPVAGSLWWVVLLAFLFLVATLGQSLAIAAGTRSQQVATELAMMTTLMPGTILSGFLFPLENMPEPLQAVSAALPVRYFLSGLRDVLVRGAGWEVIAPDLAVLGGFALVLGAIAVWRFQGQSYGTVH